MPAPHRSAPSAPDRPRRDAVGARSAPFAPSVTIAGTLAAALAAVPLVGWGAGWPPLAGYLTGWPVVSPFTAVALLVGAIALLVSSARVSRGVRRGADAVAGALLIGVALLPVLLPPLLPAGMPPTEAAALVERWTTAPGLLGRIPPAPTTASALGFLGAALLLLAVGGAAAVRAAWIAAGGAALVALLTAGVAPVDVAPAPASPFAAEIAASLPPMPPPVAMVVLVLASAVLLVRTPGGGWWIPGSGAATRLVRLMAPGLLLIPPALVWTAELLVRRRTVPQDAIIPMLASALVVALGLLLALAARRVARDEEAERQRGLRRAERQVRRGTEQAAHHADRTVRVASERYRAHLRGILEASPAPFLALDREGYVAYVNGAAAQLLAFDPDEAAGRPVWELWPDLGPELRAAVTETLGRGELRRTLVSAASGRAFEVRGYPDDTGAALFLRELDTNELHAAPARR